MMAAELERLLLDAWHARRARLPACAEPQAAWRLFNGFTEGCPELAVDCYASTVLFHDYSPQGRGPVSAWIAERGTAFCAAHLPEKTCGLVKTRHAADLRLRNGWRLFGNTPSQEISENGVHYAVDLLLNRDAGFYLDTRPLRAWLRANLAGRRLLNTFAYTGSLGVAALAGGAAAAVQLDRTARFLDLARRSSVLNGFHPPPDSFVVGDFFRKVSYLKKRAARFDCIVLDPPFFAEGKGTELQLSRDTPRLVNKVRPLVTDGGWIVAVNNALFLSGRDFLDSLGAIDSDGYLRVETLLSAPADVTGMPETIVGSYPVDPAPFAHPTKIAVLRVRHR